MTTPTLARGMGTQTRGEKRRKPYGVMQTHDLPKSQHSAAMARREQGEFRGEIGARCMGWSRTGTVAVRRNDHEWEGRGGAERGEKENSPSAGFPSVLAQLRAGWATCRLLCARHILGKRPDRRVRNAEGLDADGPGRVGDEVPANRIPTPLRPCAKNPRIGRASEIFWHVPYVVLHRFGCNPGPVQSGYHRLISAVFAGGGARSAKARRDRPEVQHVLELESSTEEDKYTEYSELRTQCQT
ncbi:hypothetical protein C8J57DRAFT_1247158 [Mycena rebaudengoi]|nr:hypothetical protein C8J57DRAFT_1247158 [Mycena rebaudengoi]